MPRTQRVKGVFSTYHVVQRGNEKKNIFYNDTDKVKFLEIIANAREKYNFLVYAYCLMDNHVHLLINDNGNDISMLLKSINVSYVIYFNRVYSRSGHLFQDRFKSELVEDDRYLMEVSRYIHNNPVKAGIVENPHDFEWSSYRIYLGKSQDYFNFLDTSKILGCFSIYQSKAISEYEKFVAMNIENDDKMLGMEEEYQELRRDNYDYIDGISMAKARIERILVEEKITMEELLRKKPRLDETIRVLRKNSALSLKEIGTLFGGISESQVSRIVRG